MANDRDTKMNARLAKELEQGALTAASTPQERDAADMRNIRPGMQTAMDLVAQGAKENRPELVQQAVQDIIAKVRSLRSPRVAAEALTMAAAVTESREKGKMPKAKKGKPKKLKKKVKGI